MITENTLSAEENKQQWYLRPQINYLPNNLNLDEWLYVQKLYGFKNFKKDFCAHLISILYTSPVYNKELREEIEKDSGTYIPLSSKILYSKKKDYPKYIDLLTSSGIWESDNSYSTGQKCRGFRFTETYSQKPYQKYYNYTYGKLKCDNRSISSDLDPKNYLSATTRKLIDFLGYIKLDYKCSIKELKRVYDTGKISIGSYNSTGISLEKIHDQDYFAKQDEYGRLHTNIANLKSEYRNYLTTDKGLKLVSIDIKNSQPFLSTLLLNSAFWEAKNGSESRLITINDIPKIYNTLQQSNSIAALIMFTKTVESNDDVKMYKDFVLKGFLYDFLLQQFQIAGINCPDRKKAKDCVFQIFFSKEEQLRSSGAAKIFEALFPSVYRLFGEIKKDQHNLLAILLQAIESQVVIEGVVKDFLSKYDDVPVFTIHDSVLVEINKTFIMKWIMLDCIEKKVGCKPTLLCEILKPIAP